MDGEEEQSVRLGERSDDLLGAVSVMHVHVDDGDAPAPMRVQRVQRARSDVVEYTKSATGGVVEQPARARVMARRAHDAERVAVAAEQHAVDRKLDGARRSPGGVERSD